jgi:hypothetical protein
MIVDEQSLKLANKLLTKKMFTTFENRITFSFIVWAKKHYSRTVREVIKYSLPMAVRKFKEDFDVDMTYVIHHIKQICSTQSKIPCNEFAVAVDAMYNRYMINKATEFNKEMCADIDKKRERGHSEKAVDVIRSFYEHYSILYKKVCDDESTTSISLDKLIGKYKNNTYIKGSAQAFGIEDGIAIKSTCLFKGGIKAFHIAIELSKSVKILYISSFITKQTISKFIDNETWLTHKKYTQWFKNFHILECRGKDLSELVNIALRDSLLNSYDIIFMDGIEHVMFEARQIQEIYNIVSSFQSYNDTSIVFASSTLNGDLNECESWLNGVCDYYISYSKNDGFKILKNRYNISFFKQDVL